MNGLPFPEPIAELLDLGQPGNRSLLFDRGAGEIADRKKEAFLQDFVQRFAERHSGKELEALLARREAALAQLGVATVDLFTQTRLVVGLGLPHPTETGFLFDRLTGCPYLPGSSVKGLLRAAARLVAAGDLEGDKDFWAGEGFLRIFGPEIGGEAAPRKGDADFYDAFPVEWPKLDVDVLTPHHRPDNIPADWEKPIPVPFLTVAPGTRFRFSFSARHSEKAGGDLEQIKSLLPVALDWLGIGGKKAAGYGYFGEKAPPEPVLPPRSAVAVSGPSGARPDRPHRSERQAPPPLPPPKELLWPDAELGWHKNYPAAFRGKQIATGSKDRLEADLLDALKDKKAKLRGDVVVVKRTGGDLQILRITNWRKG
ncbi:MAG TPA: type III-B CRISPR module RAMP protein Cmr6 [Thermoanaerobaculia bacterium]